jgi:hypothetical protein
LRTAAGRPDRYPLAVDKQLVTSVCRHVDDCADARSGSLFVEDEVTGEGHKATGPIVGRRISPVRDPDPMFVEGVCDLPTDE